MADDIGSSFFCAQPPMSRAAAARLSIVVDVCKVDTPRGRAMGRYRNSDAIAPPPPRTVWRIVEVRHGLKIVHQDVLKKIDGARIGSYTAPSTYTVLVCRGG